MTPEPTPKHGEIPSQPDAPGLSSSRAEFAASLPRRLDTLLSALHALQQLPTDLPRRDNFLRRIHALSASTKILGFAAAAELLARAEQRIRATEADLLPDEINRLSTHLADLTTLVQRGAYSAQPINSPLEAPKSVIPQISEPLAIIVWGSPDFLTTLTSVDKTSNALEILSVTDPDKLREASVAFGPDVLLLDADQGSIALMVDQLAQAPETKDVAIIVANVPDPAASRLRELGARLVLPSRTNAQQLSRALLQVRHASFEHAPAPLPLGAVTLKELAEHLAQEIRAGLVDAAPPEAILESIELGDGTVVRAALWSALAQIREHITETTDRHIRFAPGPEGGVPLAPRAGNLSRVASQASVDSLDLSGRRILVVDDDPAVAWFVGATLRAAGATVTEVHDGNQALQLAYRLWPELIVSDVVMPGVDGFALCHAAKRDVLLRDVPIILLSWKEDLLFRLRDFGADADGYLRKEANASTIVRRVKELLLPRSALERRLAVDRETRGRLDSITTRLLLELAAALPRPVRIALRDASAQYDIRIRHGSLATIVRTRTDGRVDTGESVIGAMLGITAGRFSVVTDRDPCDATFTAPLSDVFATSVLRARAAQRVLSGLSLGLIDRLTLDQDAFGSDLPMLPLSLRPIAEELLRGTAPRQLLASGVASVQLLESLLSDVARRGAVLAIADAEGNDLLDREIAALTTAPSIVPPKPPSSPPPLFTFQLSPAAPPVSDATHRAAPTPNLGHARTNWQSETTYPGIAPNKPPTWHLTSPSPLAAMPSDSETAAVEAQSSTIAIPPEIPTPSEPARPEVSRPQPPAPRNPPAGNALTDDVDWALELSWDTPSPIQQDPASTEPASVKPITSGGFMRPSIATLQRSALQETPDLADAVVRAVSEATPCSDGLTLPESPGSHPPPPDAPDAQPDPRRQSNAEPTTADRPAEPILELPSTLEFARADSRPAILNPSGEPHPSTPTQPNILPAPNHPAPSAPPTTGAQAPEPSAQLSAPVEPSRSGQTPSESRAVLEEIDAAPESTPEKPSQEVVAIHPPAPTPPPPISQSLHPARETDTDGEDPVFPLVSTATAAVDIQPSIDVGASPSQSSIPQTAPQASGPAAPQNRDTLRSPDGATVDPRPESSLPAPNQPACHPDPAIAPTTTAAESAPLAAKPDPAPPPNSSGAESSPPTTKPDRFFGDPHRKNTTATPRSASHISASTEPAIPQPRPIGLIQALGLAALAGIVTFGITVPIAGWFHKHGHPANSELPLPPDAFPLASSASGGTTEPPKPNLTKQEMTLSTTGPAPSGNAGPQRSPDPVIQDLGVPSEPNLTPGQALLEVTTTGGHAIFVDDVFVGRGPVRVITVHAGRHVVRTRLNGTERSDAVDVAAGRSIRLSLERSWP
jgi:CheY-like chemotaxis protein